MKHIETKQFNYVHDNEKTWSVQDQPYNKLYEYGVRGMTDTELLAVLLQSAPHATILARTLYSEANNNLSNLSNLSASHLTNIKGLTPRKAAMLIAAFEIGRRTQGSAQEKHQIKSSQTVCDLMKPKIGSLQHEEFWLITMNRSNRVIDTHKISQGGMTGTVIDTRIILKKCLDDAATTMIVCHNHPSGNSQPSEADIKITEKLRKAAELLEITLLDHVIVTEGGYFSLADEGMLK